MDFSLDDMQQAIRDVARSVASEEVTKGWSASLRSTLAEVGFWGLLSPEDVGGSDLDAVSFVLVIEELAKASPAIAMLVANHCGPASALVASDDAKRATSGEKLFTYVFCAGDSCVVPSGDVVDGVFLVDASQRVFSGIQSQEAARPLGLDAVAWASWKKGMQVDMPHPERLASIARAAVLLGAGERAFSVARDYSLDRKQFGRPIAKFQAIQWKIAETKMRLDAARMFLFDACQKEDAASALVASQLAFDAARLAADEAIQIHGGYGYTKEYQPESLLRDVLSLAPRRARVRSVSAASILSES